MSLEIDQRRSGYGGAAFSVVVISLMAYLAFAAVQGDHGLLRLLEIEAKEQELREELARLEAERTSLANRAKRLAVEQLDLDLLDERARAVLGLARPDELLIR